MKAGKLEGFFLGLSALTPKFLVARVIGTSFDLDFVPLRFPLPDLLLLPWLWAEFYLGWYDGSFWIDGSAWSWPELELLSNTLRGSNTVVAEVMVAPNALMGRPPWLLDFSENSSSYFICTFEFWMLMVPLIPDYCLETLFLIPLLLAIIYACDGLFKCDERPASELLNWWFGTNFFEFRLDELPFNGVFLDWGTWEALTYCELKLISLLSMY